MENMHIKKIDPTLTLVITIPDVNVGTQFPAIYTAVVGAIQQLGHQCHVETSTEPVRDPFYH